MGFRRNSRLIDYRLVDYGYMNTAAREDVDHVYPPLVCSRMLTSSYPFKFWIPCLTPGVNTPFTLSSMFCMMFSGVTSVVEYTSP